MIQREADKALTQLAKWYPVVAVVGPRQSGKTTLIKNVFKDYTYVNLEDDFNRRLATSDPVGFVNSFGSHVVFDEIQNCPALFSQIQVTSDENEITGNYVISGSRNLALSKNIRQSLAGRVGILKLLPLSLNEINSSSESLSVNDAMLLGGYPRLYASQIKHQNFYRNYIETYVDKDVRIDLKEINLSDYKKMIRVCAQYAGNLINYSNIASAVGISRQTVKSWMSLLMESFICFELPAFYSNKLKSLTKSPKLYFYDTGLLCYLLGVKSTEDLMFSANKGQIFENFVISETVKKYHNSDSDGSLYFYRDNSKREIDLVDATNANDIQLAEIKSTSTFDSKLMKNLKLIGDSLCVKEKDRHLIMNTDRHYSFNEMNVENVTSWIQDLDKRLR